MNVKKMAIASVVSVSFAVGSQAVATCTADAATTLRASCPSGTSMSMMLSHTNGATTCFSGAGSLATNLTGVTSITAAKSGHLWANVTLGGPSVRIDFPGGTCLVKRLAKVTSVSIY